MYMDKNTSLKINLSPGKDLIIKHQPFAPQANAAVMATLAGTTVLATVTAGRVDEEKDYFPLSVEFADKLYAGGIIKSSRWQKREGGWNDESILLGRLIDRSLRPLFPAGFKNEVQIVINVLGNNKENGLIIPAFNAAALALAISDIPFNSPVSATQVGLVDKKLVLNLTNQQLDSSDLDLIVCTGPFGVNMIEAGANIVDNKTVLEAITAGNDANIKINKQIEDIAKKIAKPKFEYINADPTDELIAQVETKVNKEVEKFLESGQDDGKHIQSEQLIFDALKLDYQDQIKSEEIKENVLRQALDTVVKKHLKARTLAGKRFDGRKMDQVRPITVNTSVLSQVHGSALFQRGLTQALSTVVLGSLAEKIYANSSTGEVSKRYMHYYNAPPFSIGQTGRVGRPGRREIGHGALAEKALKAVIPTEDVFPYTIIINSEVLSQNGSSSMASTCGSTLSLMDAGVPITDMVAGISIGMVSDGDDKYTLLTDIAGIEDHNGDMDFKITGTKTGITAIQLDVKRPGLTLDMIQKTFKASTIARLSVLDSMARVLDKPRSQLSPLAPKVVIVRLPEDKIGEVIGSSGKVIKGLMKQYAVQIDIDDDGVASISSNDFDKTNNCAEEIRNMIREIEIGEEFDGKVVRVEPYGVFVEMVPGKEALLHVSELSGGFIQEINSIVKLGDIIHVKVSGRNQENQIKLTAPKFKQNHPAQASRSQPAGQSDSIGKFRPPTNNKYRRPRS
ncbi:MAG: polyribonucleotide nucleotidyltransferase [Dehalococcoidia bacterium]|nr:MAG: polyribonucleotide nucleotidyltransferase [Dehalococcoidia bacterium]